MTVLRSIPAHGTTTRSVISYLTRHNRAVADDFIHCSERDMDGFPVWKQMDETRRLLGTSVSIRGRPVRTWQHFVISPDPADHVDLRTLRDLAYTWARRYFPDYQVAIYYHDDNALGIPHAHIVVNNPNLASGTRVSSLLTDDYRHEVYLGLQDLAEERGLSRSPDWGEGAGHDGSVQSTYRTRQDMELEEKGISWKRDVRDRMACAMRLSETEADYVDACHALGLTVRVSKSRRRRGEYVYGHPASGREVAGSTLGSSWSREGVRKRLEEDLVRGVTKPRGAARKRLLEALGSFETADGSMALQVLGITHGVEVTAEMVSSMLDACATWDVVSTDDFAEALSEVSAPEELQLLTEARDLAACLGWLPKERNVEIDGWRTRRFDEFAFMGDGDADDWWDPGRDFSPWAPERDTGAFEVSRDDAGRWYEEMDGRSF